MQAAACSIDSRAMPEAAQRLIIGIGNLSRGDDALGPLCIDQLQALALPDTELITDFQLQVEYALDLAGRAEVIFVDATTSGAIPYSFAPVEPHKDPSYSSHAVSPAALLAACHDIGEPQPMSAYVLAIRGYDFALGAPLSAAARQHLQAAVEFLAKRCLIKAQNHAFSRLSD